MTYRILIVDDERIERSGIKFLLKNLNIDYETFEAPNGQAALEFIKENEIDILLTDVKMPLMDGIELIHKVSELKKNIRYVIFSGCSEFDYARQAVKLGVSDYILKPVDPAEFDKTLKRVISDIETERNENQLKDKSIKFIYEHTLYRLVNGTPYAEILRDNAGLLDIEYLKKYRRLMLMEFNNDFFGREGMNLSERIYGDFPEVCTYLNLNTTQSILLFDKDYNYPQIAERICSYVQNNYDGECYMAISKEITTPENIEYALVEAEELMESKFYHQSCHVFYDGMKNDNESIIQIDDDTLMKQMKQDVKMKDVNGLRAHFERFCNKYSKTDFSQVYIKFLFSNLLKTFYENLSGIDEKELNNEVDILYRANNFSSVKEIVEKNIDRLESAFAINPQMIHREIEIVKQYIYDHYNEEIGVEQLADMVFMAPSYLSSVFKKETGLNLSKFIKTYRMEKAKDMLENTMIKIVDISTACGYPNVSYFCSSFREYFGVSPQKFRETGEDNQNEN